MASRDRAHNAVRIALKAPSGWCGQDAKRRPKPCQQSDALRSVRFCEGCPHQLSGQLEAAGPALADL